MIVYEMSACTAPSMDHYDLYWSHHCDRWFYRVAIGGTTVVSGPFRTMADAAQAALADYENARTIVRATEVWQSA